MVILLQINKTNFEKKDSPEKNHTSQNQGKILKEKCCLFKKKIFPWFFLNCPKIVFENPEKNPGKLHDQTLITLVVNTINQIWNTWKVRSAHFKALFNFC